MDAPNATLEARVRLATLLEVFHHGCHKCREGQGLDAKSGKHWAEDTHRWVNCGHDHWMRMWLVRQINAAGGDVR